MSDFPGCWISRPPVWRPGQHPDARELCAQTPARTVDLGDGYEVIICDRHLAALRAVPVASEVLWRYGQSHTADGELTWDARLSADASADYERDGG